MNAPNPEMIAASSTTSQIPAALSLFSALGYRYLPHDDNLKFTELCPTSHFLRQSILKQAFAGTLVPQAPADKPSSPLLARIKAERAKTVKASKRKSLHAS